MFVTLDATKTATETVQGEKTFIPVCVFLIILFIYLLFYLHALGELFSICLLKQHKENFSISHHQFAVGSCEETRIDCQN